MSSKGEEVFEALIKEIKGRSEHGRREYGGEGFYPFDGTNSLQDLFEELLDALVYLTKLRMERERITSKLRDAFENQEYTQRAAWAKVEEVLAMLTCGD